MCEGGFNSSYRVYRRESCSWSRYTLQSDWAYHRVWGPLGGSGKHKNRKQKARASVITLKQCLEHCAVAARCTGVEYKGNAYCAFWFDGKCGAPGAKGWSKSTASTATLKPECWGAS